MKVKISITLKWKIGSVPTFNKEVPADLCALQCAESDQCAEYTSVCKGGMFMTDSTDCRPTCSM